MAFNFDEYPPQITQKYKITKKLGKGAYGTVFNAIDKKTKKRLAIKRVEDVFGTTTDAKRALREISIMRLCRHPNVVLLKNVYALPDDDTFKHLWVVMEYGGLDLGRLIKNIKRIAGWVEHHVRFLSWQILAGLNYLHSANIAHRDLKPSNILVTEDNHVSLIDFGLARQLRAIEPSKAPAKPALDKNLSLQNNRKHTQHVVTRWYRPPELIILQGQYTAAIDVWSFGCIFGELLKTLNKDATPGPLFPGRSSFPSSRDHYRAQDLEQELAKETHQINQIFALIGTPAKDEFAKIHRSDIRRVLEAKKTLKPKDLNKYFSNVPGPAVDIVAASLKFDPDKRATVAKMMAHPYFKTVVQSKSAFGASAAMKFPFEDVPRLRERAAEKLRLRKLICEEIKLINK